MSRSSMRRPRRWPRTSPRSRCRACGSRRSGGFLALVPEAGQAELGRLGGCLRDASSTASVRRRRRRSWTRRRERRARRGRGGASAALGVSVRPRSLPVPHDADRAARAGGPCAGACGARGGVGADPGGGAAGGGDLPVLRGRGRAVPPGQAVSAGAASRPRRPRSARRASGEVKRMASMPRAAAPATFAALSSMKMQCCGDEAVAGEAAAVDLGVGLHDALVAGDDDVAEAAGEEGEARQGLGPLRGRIVGDGVERHAGGVEVLEDGDGGLDLAGQGFVPAVVEGADQVGAVRVAVARGWRRLRPRRRRGRSRGSRRGSRPRRRRRRWRPRRAGAGGRAGARPSGAARCRCRRSRPSAVRDSVVIGGSLQCVRAEW